MFVILKKKISSLCFLVSKKQYAEIIRILKHKIFKAIYNTGIIELPYLPYYILRYYNLVDKNLFINEDINFETDENNKFFKNKLLNSKLYLEYGSGSSTILADKENINYYSIESDKNFYTKLKKKIKGKNYILKDLGLVSYNSRPVLFSYRKHFLKKKAKEYANNVLKELSIKNLIPDLILIDGRYRVLCGLYVYKFLREKNTSTTILIDDYDHRAYLHILEKLFHIEVVGRFGVCTQLKKYENVDKLIKIYSKVFQ